MSTAQNLRTAAINDTQPYGLDWAVMEVFIDNSEYRSYSAADDLTCRTFLLIVAEALDYREPMQSMGLGDRCDLISRVQKVSSNVHGIIRAVERHHGIGESK